MRLLSYILTFALAAACATQPTAKAAIEIANTACIESWGGGRPSSFSPTEWRADIDGQEWRIWTQHASDNRCYEVRMPRQGIAFYPTCLTCVAY